jgi:hypothetical protein
MKILFEVLVTLLTHQPCHTTISLLNSPNRALRRAVYPLTDCHLNRPGDKMFITNIKKVVLWSRFSCHGSVEVT